MCLFLVEREYRVMQGVCASHAATVKRTAPYFAHGDQPCWFDFSIFGLPELSTSFFFCSLLFSCYSLKSSLCSLMPKHTALEHMYLASQQSPPHTHVSLLRLQSISSFSRPTPHNARRREATQRRARGEHSCVCVRVSLCVLEAVYHRLLSKRVLLPLFTPIVFQLLCVWPLFQNCDPVPSAPPRLLLFVFL